MTGNENTAGRYFFRIWLKAERAVGFVRDGEALLCFLGRKIAFLILAKVWPLAHREAAVSGATAWVVLPTLCLGGASVSSDATLMLQARTLKSTLASGSKQVHDLSLTLAGAFLVYLKNPGVGILTTLRPVNASSTSAFTSQRLDVL